MFFDVGFVEVLFLFVVALLVIGPKDLPVVAKQVFIYFRKIRSGFLSVKAEVEKELDLDDLKSEFSQKSIKSTLGYDEFQASLDELKRESEEAAKEAKMAAQEVSSASKEALDEVEAAAHPDDEPPELHHDFTGDEESETPEEKPKH